MPIILFFFNHKWGDAHLWACTFHWTLDPTENSSEKNLDAPPTPSYKNPHFSLISKWKSESQGISLLPWKAEGILTLVLNETRAGWHTSRSDRLHFHPPGHDGHEDSLLVAFSAGCSCGCGCIAVKCITGSDSPCKGHVCKLTHQWQNLLFLPSEEARWGIGSSSDSFPGEIFPPCIFFFFQSLFSQRVVKWLIQNPCLTQSGRIHSNSF